MRSETTDFAVGAATWRTGRNIRVVFDSDPFAPLSKNDVIYKIGSTCITASLSDDTKPWPQVTCTEKMVKFGYVVFFTAQRYARPVYTVVVCPSASVSSTTNLSVYHKS